MSLGEIRSACDMCDARAFFTPKWATVVVDLILDEYRIEWDCIACGHRNENKLPDHLAGDVVLGGSKLMMRERL